MRRGTYSIRYFPLVFFNDTSPLLGNTVDASHSTTNPGLPLDLTEPGSILHGTW